ncbi:hypothetical protein KSF_094210 [Reticulibacter mediterranei]|uniref:TIR domain-containing protein n=2 Tax=Reticulibacter mediterranei TaxID=2778369 RepID=A0A8J3IVL8_9CHLR|nr:hypothetical protein KSF_094210 [Reticulibacter mediterranei]
MLTALEKGGCPIKVYEREVTANTPYILQKDNDLETADIILLLVSWDFVACDYCYSDQMHRAVKRHMEDECQILPILIEECTWEKTPFAIIPMLPGKGKTLKNCKNKGSALKDISKWIERAVDHLQARQL